MSRRSSTTATGSRRGYRSRRAGVVMSMELLYAMSIALMIVFAAAQFSIILSTKQQLQAACKISCRVGTMPNADQIAVERAAAQVLDDPKWKDRYHLIFYPGQHSGDPVTVEIRMPMAQAAPPLVGWLVRDREIVERTIMRKE